jgi:para-nitrobenzyl esterase
MPIASRPSVRNQAQYQDCLYLNVWTAVRLGADSRPVMVFFHSGWNSLWSGSMPVFGGNHLARKGAVVTTLNFRLGPNGNKRFRNAM